MNSTLGKVTIRPREKRIKDMDVEGWSSWVKVSTFNLKGKPQGLGKVNHSRYQEISWLLDLTSNAHEDGVDKSSGN